MDHSVYVVDSDKHYLIDPEERVIKKDSLAVPTVVQYDHNSERITFAMPRYVDGHDMSNCGKVEVHFINEEKGGRHNQCGVYRARDVNFTDDTVTFSWLIPQEATQYAGTIRFGIRFVCMVEAVIDYIWNTAIYNGITVSPGLFNGETTDDEVVTTSLLGSAVLGEMILGEGV